MGQIFRPSSNTVARVSIGALVLLLGGGLWLALSLDRSPFVTQVGFAREQPVPFSHQHHVAGLGIDCRYCHTTVETGAFAGMPNSETCMNCHSQIWSDSPMLAPVRESYRTGKPLVWTRVNNLPDYVYFNHSIHVNRGVGCNTCHGQVDAMPLMQKGGTDVAGTPLTMGWCLECHRHPEKYVRPPDQVFNMNYRPDQATETQLAARDASLERIHKGMDANALTNCSTCHR